jgi:S-DNA-T family DNA segregation ATPase FtsK/SpoIIIE
MKNYRLPPKDLANEEFKKMLDEYPSKTRRNEIPLGIDKEGKILFKNISELEDILVGGTTSTGKTNFLNTIICSILMRQKPSETKLVLIDNKGYEFNTYDGIPHLLTPIVKTPEHASKILNSLITGATNRKKIYNRNNVNTFDEYNKLVRKEKRKNPESKMEHLPNIIVIIDDYSLMSNVENRRLLEDLLKINNYTGIHVICGTSLPEENIITKEMRDYFYTRVSFNFVEDEYIKFILGCREKKEIEGENNYIVKTNDKKYYELSNILLEDDSITIITDYLKFSDR